jgi:hypothetical protein
MLPRSSLVVVTLLTVTSPLGCQAPPDLLASQPANSEVVVALAEAVTAAPVAPADDALRDRAGGATWVTPPGWEARAASSSMRLAEWAVPGLEGADAAECALFAFAGSGGSVQANIQRWLGQFEQPDGVPTAERAEQMTMTVNGVPTTLLQVTGVFLSQNPPMTGPIVPLADHAMFAAIFETPGAPHFIKCVGPRATIGGRATELSTFVMSFAFDAATP